MRKISLVIGLVAVLALGAANAEDACTKGATGSDKVTAQKVSAPVQPGECNMPPGIPDLNNEKTIIFDLLFGCLGFLPNVGSRIISLTFLEYMTAYMQAGLGAAEVYSPSSEAVTPVIDTKIARRPTSEHTPLKRNTAMFYAIYRVAERYQASVPDMFAFIDSQFKAAKLNSTNNCISPMSNPVCVGNAVAKAIVNHFSTFGWNRDGDINRTFNGQPYEDYSGYVPTNNAYKLDNIYAWQPMMETDGQGWFWSQGALVPWAGKYLKHLVLNDTEYARRTVPPPPGANNCTTLKKEVDEMLALNAKLGTNDTMKMLAEMVNGPPYAFKTMAYLTLAVNQTYWNSHRMFAYLAGLWATIHDGQTIMWREKYKHNAVRPQSVVRHFYGNTKIKAFAGPGKGTQMIPGNEWVSYVRTDPEPEYPSGSLCWVTIWTEWLQFWLKLSLGTTNVDIPLSFSKSCSTREPGMSPATDINLKVNFASTQAFIDLGKLGRVSSGVHFMSSVDASQKVCSGLAGITWAKMMPKS